MLIVEFKVVCKDCGTEFQVTVAMPTSKEDLQRGKCPKCKSSNYTVPKKLVDDLFRR